MATSPIYSWPEPDNTDLVKNGALAIRTLGNAIDTTMATMTPKSLVDAKGDLIAATANDTPARLAVGNNGETLVADSSTSTGLRYQAVQTRNAFYNSAFDIWQRGTSGLVINGGAYTADRWFGYSATTGKTVSRQTGTTGLNYCARVQRDSGNTSTSDAYFGQPFEIIDATKFAGKTVTWSFYARAGANYSAASSALGFTVLTGTGTVDSNAIVSGYTGQTAAGTTTATLTTSWQRFSLTFTLNSNVTQFTPYFSFTPTGTAGANDYFEVTGVALEVGSVATTYVRQSGSIQGELAACQRYFNRIGGSATFQYFGSGFYVAATTMRVTIPFPIMRTAPTFNASAGNTFLSTNSGNPGGDVGSAIAADVLANTCAGLNLTVPSRTAGIGGALVANNSLNTFLEFSAEL